MANMNDLQFCVDYTSHGEDYRGHSSLEEFLNGYYMSHLGGQHHSACPAPQCTTKTRTEPLDEELQQKYSKSHRMWKPAARTERMALCAEPNSVDDNGFKRFGPSKEKAFISYLHTPVTFGESPLPALVYHTSCEANDSIITVGGVIAHHQGFQTGILDVSKYKVRGVNMPLPINSVLLNHPAVLPNTDVFVTSSLTNQVARANVTGDIPPPLLCMSSSKITKRHIFYYGGFELLNEVTYSEDSGKFMISKSTRLNNSAYVLDTVTMRFKKFELIAQPNKLNRFPITVPRFGHSSTSIASSRISNYDLKNDTPATILIMGGYRQVSGLEKFEAIKDLWKVELSIVYQGTHGYIEFGDVVLATPIPVPEEFPIPSGRAFHSCEVFQVENVFGSNLHDTKSTTDPSKLSMARSSTPSSAVSERQLNLKLIVHGGTDGKEIFGDVWYFDVDQELWERVPTFSHGDEPGEEVQLKKVGHRGIIIDNYFVALLGASPIDFPNLPKANNDFEIRDISNACFHSKETLFGKLCQPHTYEIYSLHIPSRKWSLYDVYHSYRLPKNAANLSYFGNIGYTVVNSNLKTFIIGGNLLPNPLSTQADMTRLILLHNAVSIFEFPLNLSEGDPLKI